jgi:hypothetical protein
MAESLRILSLWEVNARSSRTSGVGTQIPGSRPYVDLIGLEGKVSTGGLNNDGSIQSTIYVGGSAGGQIGTHMGANYGISLRDDLIPSVNYIVDLFRNN